MTTFAQFDCNDLVLPFVGQHLGYEMSAPCFTVGFLREGNLVAGLVYNGYTGTNVDVSFAGPGELSWRVVRTAATFAFRELGVYRITCRTRRGNRALTRGLPKIGFRYEGIMQHYYGPRRADDAVQFGLLRENAGRLVYNG